MYLEHSYRNYKYLVTASDNYMILTNHSSVNGSWDNPQTISVIYKYLNPSFITIEGSRSFSNYQSFPQVDISESFFSRADALNIITVQFIIIFFIVFLLNGLTRFVKKGGVFFGS